MKVFHWTSPGMRFAVLVIGILAHGNGARADFRFGTPANLGSPPNSAYADMMPSASSDGLEVYFWSNRPGGFGNWDLWVSTRASTEDQWLPAMNLGPVVNSADTEGFPCISASGLELYFSRGSESAADIMVVRRAARTEPWGMPENLGSFVNSSASEYSARLTSDGLELYFTSTRSGGRGLSDTWVAKRATVIDDWSPPANLYAINSGSHDQWVNLSSDSLTLMFQSDRSGGEYGGLFMSRRTSMDDPWTSPVYVGLPMTGSVYTILSGVSSDGSMLFLSDHINYAPRSGGAGGADMWQVPVIPVMDFSGDGSVDLADLLAMIDCWGMDDPFFDIGPMPWGDGVVDKKDLEVLMRYWDQEVPDSTLIAHWRFDETEGMVAYDTSGNHDGIVTGIPMWQADSGMVDGALQFDGDTAVIADCVLDPSAGLFSVFAWIRGGAPGQVILSQAGGKNWLMADARDGTLATAVIPPPSRTPVPPLVSDAQITDGNWHRIGFVWDGISRVLYVDGVLVAADAQLPPARCTGDMNIGCDTDATAGTFWTGLIDDVRMYNRAIRP